MLVSAANPDVSLLAAWPQWLYSSSRERFRKHDLSPKPKDFNNQQRSSHSESTTSIGNHNPTNLFNHLFACTHPCRPSQTKRLLCFSLVFVPPHTHSQNHHQIFYPPKSSDHALRQAPRFPPKRPHPRLPHPRRTKPSSPPHSPRRPNLVLHGQKQSRPRLLHALRPQLENLRACAEEIDLRAQSQDHKLAL
jgi:hypothetical protein